jgi:hypothetical protein
VLNLSVSDERITIDATMAGLEDYLLSGLAGCPWCGEFYHNRASCLICEAPLMTSDEYREFIGSHDWISLPLGNDADALLAAGYLRSSGVLARLSKTPPISMYPIGNFRVLWVARDQEDHARSLMRELFERFTNCARCGHVLFIDEQGCSYCEAEKDTNQ